MKTSLCYITGIVALCLTACQTVKEEAGHVQFQAIMESTEDTKTFLSSAGEGVSNVLWSSYDEIGVYIDASTTAIPFKLTKGAGTQSATFSGEGSGSSYLAVYPLSMTASRSENTLKITLPEEQTYTPDTFADDSYPMVAVSSSEQLSFRNLCSVVRLSLIGSQAVSRIVFRPNESSIMVSGTATVDVSNPSEPILTMGSNACDSVALNTGGVKLNESSATDFYLVLPPQTYPGGFTVRIYADGYYMEKIYDRDFTMLRSKMHKAGAFGFMEPTSTSQYLTFASEGTTTLSLTNEGGNAPVLYYSYDKTNWTLWDYSKLSFSAGAPLYLCGDNPEGFSKSVAEYSRFRSSGAKFSVSGSVMSLLDKDQELLEIPNSCCFFALFSGCQILLSAPELPATTLASSCYGSMFGGCTSLTSAPDLPATTLASVCYASMFEGCTGLTSVPTLPVTTLAEYCYRSMFSGCSSLTTAPELPATTLVLGCYSNMFAGCTSLETPPRLPATTLASDCYACMFMDCKSLTTAPELPATTLASSCYYAMFMRCTRLETAPELPATTLTEWCYHWMFCDCTKLNYVKCLATDISAAECLDFWLGGVAASGTFVKAAGMNDWPTGVSGIPEGWTVKNEGVPEVNTTLKEVRDAITSSQESATLGNNVIVQGVVISNAALNNLTDRELIIQDQSAGIAIYCTEAHGFEFGDVLTLDFSNATLKWYNGYLDVPDFPVTRIQKIGHEVTVAAKEVSVTDFLNNQYESQYVAIENAQVASEDLGKTWVIGEKGTQIGIECSDYSRFIVYSRKTASYGSEIVPEGSGTIKGISSRYGDLIQLVFAQDSDRAGLNNSRFQLEYEYSISLGVTTKTSISESGLVWKAGDKVYLSDGNTSAVCTIPNNYDGATIAVVKTQQRLTDPVYCIYPGDAVTQDGAASWLVTVPEDQEEDGSAYAVYCGVSDTKSIQLSAKTALIKVTLTSAMEDLSFIRITTDGAPIAGQLQIDASGASVISGTQSVKVAAQDSDELYFCVLPGSFSKMDIDLYKTDGSFARKTFSDKTLSEGRIYYLSINPTTLSFTRDEAVDLGLSVKWASYNLCESGFVSSPEVFGDYYAWGEIEKKESYYWTNYRFRIEGDSWQNVKFSKYNTKSSYGDVDNKVVLDPEDDVAHTILGDNWRIPTNEQWVELSKNCTWTQTALNGIEGFLITGKNGNSIFLPKAGCLVGDGIHDWSNSGCYWTSSLREDMPSQALDAILSSNGAGNSYTLARFEGLPVRPVTE